MHYRMETVMSAAVILEEPSKPTRVFRSVTQTMETANVNLMLLDVIVMSVRMVTGTLFLEMAVKVAIAIRLEAITHHATPIQASVTVSQALSVKNVTNVLWHIMDIQPRAATPASAIRVVPRDHNVTSLDNAHVTTMLKVDAAIVVKKISTIGTKVVWTALLVIIWSKKQQTNIAES